MTQVHTARFAIGQIVRHRDNAFRGVVMDSITVTPPRRRNRAVAADQPFYRVFALGEDGGFVAYAAEGVLEDGQSVCCPMTPSAVFTTDAEGHHAPCMKAFTEEDLGRGARGR
jgi:heat shock protein HspQ